LPFWDEIPFSVLVRGAQTIDCDYILYTIIAVVTGQGYVVYNIDDEEEQEELEYCSPYGPPYAYSLILALL
jgi:hypothetical protein